jgi:hypothetical protein
VTLRRITIASIIAVLVVFCAIVGYAAYSGWSRTTQYLGAFQRYANEGCVIAADAPRPDGEARLVELGLAERHEGWLMLGPALCTIAPPQITATLKATDPDVAPFISAVDIDPEYPGCFLDTAAMQARVQITRGWSAERAFQEYLRMFGAGVFSGEWRFFNDDPLATPVAVQYTGGECANLPYAAALAESHSDMIAAFDGFIRMNAPALPCEAGGAMGYIPWAEEYETLGQGPVINAWLKFEVYMALLSSDWVEGVSLTHKGTPRPPLCMGAATGKG